MLNVDRLEAIGPRGEAVIIVRTTVPDANGQADSTGSTQARFELATGEKLVPVENEHVFETRDGRRRYTLRNRPS